MIGTFFKRVFGIGNSKTAFIRIDKEAYGVKQEAGISRNRIERRSESLFAIRRREHNRRIGAIAFESRRRNRD